MRAEARQNLLDVRSEVRQNLADIKSEVRQNLADVKSDTYAAVDRTREDAKTAISHTTDATSLQISQIRERSATIAIGEAQKRVDEAFRTTNVQKLVEESAQRQVGPVIDRKVQTEVDREMASLQDEISALGQIADAGLQMRIGIRAGLDELGQLKQVCTNGVDKTQSEIYA
jgi:hypothetical protein